MRLLVVEDESDLARTLKLALEEERFVVDVATDGDEALVMAQGLSYAAIVLDLMLPGVDGAHVLARLRADGSRTPILILTARDTLEDKVGALTLGADDYVTKPFSVAELVARVRALIRRASTDPAPTIVIGDVSIDTGACTVRRGGRLVALTAREYAIIELLARRRGTLVTRQALEEHLYPDDRDVFSNVVDVHVAALRRKLGPSVIATRRGHGYLIDA